MRQQPTLHQRYSGEPYLCYFAYLYFSDLCKFFPLQFSALTDDAFVQPGEAEAKKQRLEEKKRQMEMEKAPRKRKKGGGTAAEPVVIDDASLGVKIAKTQ